MKMNAKLCIALCLGLAAFAAAWFFYPSGPTLANAALAEYQIEKMTCGSCIGNIETALAGLGGVGSVDINLTSNRGRVTYDPDQLDSQAIAEAISAAGYPAMLRLELAPDEYLALQQEQAQLGQEYLARIGDRLLARADFEELLNHRSRGVAGAGEDDRLWKTVWQEVLQRELMLSSAEKNKVVVQGGEVEVRLEELRKEHQGLDERVVKRYGSMDDFRDRLHEDMIINRNIQDHVYAGVTDPAQQKVKLHQWYAELQTNTNVVIFDSRLKAGTQGGGCACCSS